MGAPLALLPGPDLALDLGTARTRIGRSDERILAEAPSRAPRQPEGDDAPLVHGVVRDVAGVTRFLRPLLCSARGRWPVRPRVLACAPSDASTAERAALVEATLEAGAGQVALMSEPLAAALGTDLDLASPRARALVDVGDGVTDVALFRSGRLARSAALRLACGELRDAVLRAVAAEHGIHLERDQADRLLRELGPPGAGDAEWLVARRRHTRARLEFGRVVVEVDSYVRASVLSKAIDPLCTRIAGFVGDVLRSLGPETAAEVVESGLVVTGGGALVPRVTALLAAATGLNVRPAHDPARAVIRGACRLLSQASREGLWRH